MKSPVKLGVNIDHVATLRQARGGIIPNLCAAALDAQKAGADGITIHLREDRRHIQDHDLPALQKAVRLPMNLEMALHPEMIKNAKRYRPDKVCIVPEKRQELTTEGGLNAFSAKKILSKAVPELQKKGIQVSLFLDPIEKQLRIAQEVGAHAVEIHTGTYANCSGAARKFELKRIVHAAQLGKKLGLVMHAGHGLDYENVRAIAAIPEIEELNIGYAIIARAVFVGLQQAVREMKQAIRQGVLKR